MTYYSNIVQFKKMLTNLSAMLDKAQQLAEEKKFDVAVLLQARLAPDQFNFIRQVQITCDTAKVSAASLANVEIPSHPDTEVTLPELKGRIDKVIQYLHTFKEDSFAHADKQKVTRPRWEGRHLTGAEFFVEHAVPNFYFHLTTAYAILRHNGVSLGKKDFLGPINYKQ